MWRDGCVKLGSEFPALAAEGDQLLKAAAIALDAQEPVFQQAAFQVVFKLPADVIR